MSEYGYLQFPLCLIRETFRDTKDGLDLIIHYGIMNYAIKLDYNLSDVAQQVAYYYYRKQDVIQESIVDRLNDAIEEGLFTLDEDYNGFQGIAKFDPQENIIEILNLFDSDPQFKADSILNYQLHLATSTDHLNVTIGSNDGIIKGYNKALKLKRDFEAKYGPDVMPMCRKGILFDFRDKQLQDIDLFRAYIGIKSLIGLKKYIATTRYVILMRMLGCKTKQSMLDFIVINKQALNLHDKYSRTPKAMRCQFDKLFKDLLARGFIKSKIFERKISRKLFISVKLSYDELATEIIEFSKKRDFKNKEDDAIKRIRATI